MCDTFVALSDTTLKGDVIFGKNSDRPQGEIQDFVVVPAQTYSENSWAECTYLQIPQVETHIPHPQLSQGWLGLMEAGNWYHS